MNLKNFFLIIILAIGVLLLVACGDNTVEYDTIYEDNGANGQSAGNQSPGSGLSQSQPDIYGEVKAISGSQITVDLLQMPQGRQLTDEERKQMEDRRNNRQNNNGTPNGTPNGMRRGGAFGGGEKKYLGKSETITVNSDTPITTYDFSNRTGQNDSNDNNSNNDLSNGNNNNTGNNGRNRGSLSGGNMQQKKINLSDIKTGEIIWVWYKKDSGDKKEIESIRVMQAPNNSNNNNTK